MDPDPPPVISTLDLYDQTFRRLISGVIPQDDLAPSIETVFLDEKVADMMDSLRRDEAQTLIDVIDTVWHHAFPPPENGLIDFRFNLPHTAD